MTESPWPGARPREAVPDRTDPLAGWGNTCDDGLDLAPWAFAQGGWYGPGASAGDAPGVAAPEQAAPPAAYQNASAADLAQRIEAARARLGDRAVVLGHFYQRDDIVEHADFVGDSFQLSRAALERREARALVFCGVRFMAETADVLSGRDQAVILPNLAAGCSMADMASDAQVRSCWDQLGQALPREPAGAAAIVPVTYMNSSARIKAFCGRHGGIVCTSSNARAVVEWALARGRRVLFLPDQHLGGNTADQLGIPREAQVLWDPRLPLGGNEEAVLARARIVLWRGYCSVHRRFTLAQIEKARRDFPDVQVLVHPECRREVVAGADGAGSTDYIVGRVEATARPTTFAIGTEVTLVRRLARRYPRHRIFCLDPVVCPCSTMYRIHPAYLAWVLEELVAGRVVNRVRVPADVASDARVALDRMLEAKP